MTKKIPLILLIILLLSISLAAAYPLTTTLLEANDEAIPGGKASFTYLIKNTGTDITTYQVSPDPLDLYPFSETINTIKIEPERFTLEPGQTQELEAIITIREESLPRQQYQTIITIDALGQEEEKTKLPLLINIVRPQQLVVFSTNFPDQLVPAQDQSFDITYEATANVLILNATIHVVSEFFQDTFATPIHFKTPQTRTINYDIPTATEPGQYTIEIKAERQGTLIGTYRKTFTVARNPDVQETITRDNTLLTRTTTITKVNEGNLVVDEQIRMPLNSFQQVFTLTSPAPTAIENERIYQWNFQLKPEERATVTVVTDYRSLAIGILLVLAFIIVLSYLATRKVVIKKKIYKVKTEKDGISEIKVRLTVMNKTRDIDHATLVEPIPRLMKTTGEFGTLKPKAVQKTPLGHKLIWEFGHLHKGEERILTYTVHSKMHLVGTIKLPPAAIHYHRGKRTITYKSNSIIFSTSKKKK